MKRALLYIFFLGLLFSNIQAHAVAFAQEAKAKIAIHKIHNENTISHGISKKGSFSHKAELLNDFDDDFDDHDDYHNSGNDKLCAPSHSFYNNQLTPDYSSKTFCNTIYTHVNFSRLPRYNYISLRVLRI